MKTLIAISTCHQFEQDGSNDAIRETWLAGKLPAGFEYQFFVGRGKGSLKSDTVGLPCHDDYNSLTWKTIEKLSWGLARGFDHFFCCMADTYARPERLATCGFENFDVLGSYLRMKYNNTPGLSDGGMTQEFVNGGCGYFLSKRAATAVVSAPKPRGWFTSMLEDGFVTSATQGLKLGKNHLRFPMWGTGPRRWNDVVTKHLYFRFYAEHSYEPSLMRDEHQSWVDSVDASRWNFRRLFTPMKKRDAAPEPTGRDLNADFRALQINENDPNLSMNRLR